MFVPGVSFMDADFHNTSTILSSFIVRIFVLGFVVRIYPFPGLMRIHFFTQYWPVLPFTSERNIRPTAHSHLHQLLHRCLEPWLCPRAQSCHANFRWCWWLGIFNYWRRCNCVDRTIRNEMRHWSPHVYKG